MKNRLRVLRAEREWSQQDLADRLEVSRQSVNAIEKGRYDPSLPLAFREIVNGWKSSPLVARVALAPALGPGPCAACRTRFTPNSELSKCQPSPCLSLNTL